MGTKFKNKRKAPSLKSPHRKPWTHKEIDFALSTALVCDHPSLYEQTCRNISAVLGRGVWINNKNTKHPIDLLLWKIATGYENFRTYQPDSGRPWRGGMERTWLERRLLKWAFDPKLDAQTTRHVPPTDEYIAGVLRRSVKEIKQFRQEMLGRRGKGFGL